MAYFKTLERSRRIRMFLNEYYFGNSGIINLMRMTCGPLLLGLGIALWIMPVSRPAIAYAGICIFYGVYYSFKPWIWIYFREDNFQTIQVNIEVGEHTLRFVEEASEAEIQLNSIRRILKRRSYYILEIAKSTKMYLPFTLLTDGQIVLLDQKLTHPSR
jgi:hypothetical protein